MKFITEQLKTLVNFSLKGASFNKAIDFSNWIDIKVKDKKIQLMTSNGGNYLFVTDEIDTDEEFSVIVPAGLFSKTINKTTVPEIEMSIQNNTLVIDGNGKYSIALPSNATFINPIEDIELKNGTKFNKSTIDTMLNILKPSLDNSDITYRGYYIDNEIIVATNRLMISSAKSNVKLSKPILLNKATIDLVGLMKQDEIDCYLFDDYAIFKDDSIIVFGYYNQGIEDFAIDSIKNLLGVESDNIITFDKLSITSALDRMLLYIEDAINYAGKLKFDDGVLSISNNNNSTENVKYNGVLNDMECYVNLQALFNQINTIPNDNFSVHCLYNKKDFEFLKLVSDDIIHIIALLND